MDAATVAISDHNNAKIKATVPVRLMKHARPILYLAAPDDYQLILLGKQLRNQITEVRELSGGNMHFFR